MSVVPHNQGLCPENCFGCKVASVGFSNMGMPTRSIIHDASKTAVIHDKDAAAYKRLRQDGLQPKTVKGAASMEARANSRWEVETGQRVGSARIGERLDAVQSAVTSGETI